ncbi:MAG: CRISPR-associated protein Csx11 [Chloroflexota bacterium]
MSNSLDLQILAQHHDALLLAEVAAWLHMFGKFHEDFLQGEHGLDIQIPPDVPLIFPQLGQLLQTDWTGKVWAQLGIVELQADQLSIADLVKEHRNKKATTGLQRLMQDSHGRGSGSEKGALERFFPSQRGSVYLSTAVGFENQPIDLTVIKNARQSFYGWLEKQLDLLQKNDARVDWHMFRRSFMEEIEKLFRATVAETRQPINDISLFDQTIASVAVFKAALAQKLLLGRKDPQQHKYHWRILRLGIDGLQFWGQSAKLTDLLGRKAAIARALDGVQQFLEEDYPLGAEIYRDENGSLFIVPDVADLLDQLANGKVLRNGLQEFARRELEDESEFTLTLSDGTRTMLSFGRLANTKLPPPSANPKAIFSVWQAHPEITDVCTVCGIRPQGYDGADRPPNHKALQRNVCGICERRRTDRASEWAGKLQTTVWTNEVADANGRLALIVGQFGLDDWLTGASLGSVLAFEPSARNLKYEHRGKEYRFDYKYNQLIAEIQQLLSSSKQPDAQVPLLNYLLLSYQRVGNSFSETYDFYVGDSDLDNGKREAHLFALSLMRQQPSPARLRRIWETTRTFWQEALNERDAQGKPILVPAGKRLEIIPKNSAQLNLGKFHSYELLVNNIRISVVWDSRVRRFIVCENLAYFAKPEQLGRPLSDYLQPGKSFVLEEPAGSGARNKVWGTITIEYVNELPDDYLPAIPILTEPRTFMALVPADKAMEVIHAIRRKYETEMGKVRNRLPITLGAVFFGRRTPLFAALDAARQMLDCPSNAGDWKVAAKTDHNPTAAGWPRSVRLTLTRENESTPVEIPTVMGDKETPDVWYPYWRVEDKPTDRTRRFIGPDGEHWVHVTELKEGDSVQFTPSHFDFLWLDAASRRFEIAYDKDGRRPARPTRPFYLEDLDRLETLWSCLKPPALTVTQLKQTLQTIETARERWFGPKCLGEPHDPDGVFRQFVEDTLANAQWNWKAIPEDKRNQLIAAAVRGELTDLEELHLEILKEEI